MAVKNYENCRLCPRNCGKDRAANEAGVCGVDARVWIARAALHMWEEPCISGERGSGAVFFAGCPLHCVYCQNFEISDGKQGRCVDERELVDIFFRLEEEGAANINLVTADQYIPSVCQAIDLARANGFSLPFIYNTSSYIKEESLRLLDGRIDVYLPDMKYIDADVASNYSHAPDYPDVAKRAIAEMVRQCGTLEFDENGYIKKGVIVRHLLLPGQLFAAEKIVKYLWETYGTRIYLSLMSQYTPVNEIGTRFPELEMTVKRKNYKKLIDYAINLGVEQAYYQEGNVAKESFIPEFNR